MLATKARRAIIIIIIAITIIIATTIIIMATWTIKKTAKCKYRVHLICLLTAKTSVR